MIKSAKKSAFCVRAHQFFRTVLTLRSFLKNGVALFLCSRKKERRSLMLWPLVLKIEEKHSFPFCYLKYLLKWKMNLEHYLFLTVTSTIMKYTFQL